MYAYDLSRDRVPADPKNRSTSTLVPYLPSWHESLCSSLLVFFQLQQMTIIPGFPKGSPSTHEHELVLGPNGQQGGSIARRGCIIIVAPESSWTQQRLRSGSLEPVSRNKCKRLVSSVRLSKENTPKTSTSKLVSGTR